MEIQEEIWKDIIGYEGLYQISTLGQVKSVARLKTKGKESKQVFYPEKILTSKFWSNKYEFVSLCKMNKKKQFSIHRLVAVAFIENPENKPEVNHKDGNKSNNCVSNLEWNTRKENMVHANVTGLIRQKTEKKSATSRLNIPNARNHSNEVCRKKVMCLVTGIVYISAREASNLSGINYSTLRAKLNGREFNNTNLIYVK